MNQQQSVPVLWIPAMTPQVATIVGVVLLVLAVSFFYKAWIAVLKSKVDYWSGFLPISIISPLFVHLPMGKNSLIKSKEGLWVMCIVGPLFFIASFLCFVAGMEFCGCPGASLINQAAYGGKLSGCPLVLFDKRRGFEFPLLIMGGRKIAKIFGVQVQDDQRWGQDNNGSYNDAIQK